MIANPANVEAKPKIVEGVAGTAGGGLDRCFPPTAEAMMNVIRTGSHEIRSYL